MAARKVEVMAEAEEVKVGALLARDQVVVVGADGRAYYHGSSSHAAGALSVRRNFVHGGGAGGVGSHDPVGGAAAAQEAAGAGIGVNQAPPASFAAGYGGAPAHRLLPVAGVPIAAVALRQFPPAPFKGSWTLEEDEILKNMVADHGDRKWAMIARHLPGRVGKQCRERWINHLHPGIKKDVWTDEEDMALIEAHRENGNRWSVISRYLPGRSENNVKNHWNATKRSLSAKRRLVRRMNGELPALPIGQLSPLAEYIRSLCPDMAAGDDAAEAAPPALMVAPAPASGEYVQVQMEGSSNPAPAGQTSMAAAMYLNQVPPPLAPAPAPMKGQLGQYSAAFGGGLPDGRYPYYLPRRMNLHYGRQMQMVPQQQLIGGGATRANLFHAAPAPYAVDEGMNNYFQPDHQFPGEHINLGSNAVQQMDFDDRESSNNNHGTYYYGDPAAAGPSGGGGGGEEEDYLEVAQMASREFSDCDQDDLTLDLTKFE